MPASSSSMEDVLHGCHILLIDQNELVHRAMRRIFQRMGMSSSVAQTAQEAMRLVERLSSSEETIALDAIVLDVQLDNDDGFRLCEILRSHPFTQHIPLIVITALSDPDIHVQAFNAGADDFVSKPPQTKVLLRRLANSIARRKAEAANQLLLVELERYISSAAVEQVIHQRGVEQIQATMLFSDMRGFTAASFDHDVREVFNGINLALSIQSELVQRYDGYVDGFSGDGMLAIFEGPESSFNACSAASDIIRVARETNTDIWDPLPVGIGINCGEIIRGDLGSQNRRAHTVIGSSVNVSARLCGVARAMEAVCSEFVVDKVRSHFSFATPQNVKLKGLPAPINAYSLVVN